MPSITGTFNLVNSDNFDEYLKAIGFNTKMRKMYIPVSESIEIAKNQELDKWMIKTSSVFNHAKTVHAIFFKLGEKISETINDRSCKCQSIITQEGEDKMVHVQNHRRGLTSTILREFTETGMKMTLKGPGNVVSTRIYQRE